jgi:tape measure domain-containing protein
MAAEYTIKLDDEVSSPAKRAAKSLEGVKSGLDGVKKNASSMGSVLKGIAVGFIAIGAAAAAVTAKIVGAFGKAVISGAAFMEQQEMAFALLLKSGRKGSAELDKIRQVAVELGLPVQDTIKDFSKLLKMQFKPAAATQIIKMAADMKALGATTEEVGSIIRAISQIKGKGVLQMEELQQQLAEAGVSVQLVVKELSKATGKSAADVRKLISAGKVTADQGIEAIKAAVKAKLGISVLGEAAGKATQTLGGMWGIFKARAEDAMLTIGQRLVPKLKRSFEGIQKSFEKFKPKVGVGTVVLSISKAIDVLMAAIDPVLASLSAFGDGVAEGFGGTIKFMQPFFDAVKKLIGQKSFLEGLKVTFKNLGVVVGGALALIAAGAVGTAAAIGFLVSKFNTARDIGASIRESFSGIGGSLSEVASSVKTSATSIGKGIVDGIVNGIKAGFAAVTSAASGLAKAAVNAAKAALSESSPSKVFHDIGRNTGIGMAQGQESVAPMVAASTERMVSPRSGVQGAAQTSISNRVSSNPSISISGAQSPQETAQAVMQAQLDEMRSMYEQLAMSMGASAG